MAEISRIHALVSRGRRRLKLQSALDSATLAVIPAAASAAGVVFLLRAGVFSGPTAAVLLAACVFLVIAGAVVGFARRFPTRAVATRIDRASGLSDRLATACAFEEALAKGTDHGSGDEQWETEALMHAAIGDAVKAAPRANVVAATPFRWPEDTKAAVAFTLVAAVVAALALPQGPVEPAITRVVPPAQVRGAAIEIHGHRFSGSGVVVLGDGQDSMNLEVVRWSPRTIVARIPKSAQVGKTSLSVHTSSHISQPREFEILPDGSRGKNGDEPLAMAEDDLSYTRNLLADLKATAEANQDPELTALAKEIEELLDQAERGELSREELLDRLAKAQQAYGDQSGNEEMMEQGLADLKKTGKELQKSKTTREMGKALAQGDLEKAQEEMKKLAEKLASGKMSDKERAEAAKAFEKAAKAFEKRQAEREKQADSKVKDAQKAMDKAKQEAKQAKTDEQKQQAEKKMRAAQQKLADAKQQQQQQQEAQEKRSLKRLHRNMKQASEQMQEKSPEKQRMASRTMKDMQRNTGKVDADRRKVTNKKKVASQLDDLKEAMRRAKKGKGKGPKNRFGRNKRNADFARRARGGKSSRQAWKPGQTGKGNKPGKGKPGGKGNKPGGSEYGDEHDPNLLGDSTAKTGNAKDESVSGIHGKGPSTRETILSAAQKGFAAAKYQEVYGRYKNIVEEVINSEKVPSGYKYYVKKYFQKIKPHSM